MSHKKILISILGFCAFILAALTGYYSPDLLKSYRDYSYRQPVIPEKIEGDFAANFQLMQVSNEPMTLPDEVFFGPDGKEARFSDFKGKPLLVNLWATWCAPCVVELPSLQKLKDQYGDKMQVIAVSVDAGKDEKAISSFLEKRGIGDFAAYSDKDSALSRKVNIRGLPTSFLVGRDGLILYRFEGDADWTSQESKAFFDALLLQN